MRAVILAAGQIRDYETVRPLIGWPDLVVCADGGAVHAQALGLTPTLVLGDFDSAPPGTAEEMERRGIPVRRLPAEKDWTDTEMAVRTALEQGATDLLLLGATGSRLDHTLANLMLLADLPSGVTAAVADSNNLVRLLRPGSSLVVTGRPGALLSLLPLSPVVQGVTITGVKWPLAGAELRWGISLGVSNVLAEEKAVVSVCEGALLVIEARD